MDNEQTRRDAVAAALRQVREVAGRGDVDRAALDEIKAVLVELAKRKELFGAAAYPPPTADRPAALYLLSEDADRQFALYLVSGDHRTKSPPHNHKTWAVIAGMAGEEENVVYERVDDGSVDGVGRVAEVRRTVLCDGDAIAFMPEDIHSVRVISDVPTRHFHLYGKAFSAQHGRLAFNVKDDTCRPMSDNAAMVDTSRRVDGRAE